MTRALPLLAIESVSKHYPGRRRGLLSPAEPHCAVSDVSLEIAAGEIVALVGESGSGKSTLARIAANLIAPTKGRVLFEGLPHHQRDRTSLAQLRRQVQLIQQDASGSLDPRMIVGDQLCEIMDIHGQVPPPQRAAAALALLDEVGLPAGAFNRLPHRLSGGQRQRVVIARALTVKPRLLICDEPVSSLDVTVQAQIVDLLVGLRRHRGTTLLFVTHDLILARRIADRVAVMSAGRIVELGSAADVLERPSSEYARSLVAASLPRKAPPRFAALERHAQPW